MTYISIQNAEKVLDFNALVKYNSKQNCGEGEKDKGVLSFYGAALSLPEQTELFFCPFPL